MKRKNEYRWHVKIDDEVYQVDCKVENNRYVIWVDEVELTKVYRKSFQDISDRIEEPLLLGGKLCTFVVMNGIPDLVVDGVMLSGQDYKEMKNKTDKATATMAIVQMVIAAVAIIAYIIMAVGGVDVSRWTFTLGFGIFLLISGFLQLRNVKKEK